MGCNCSNDDAQPIDIYVELAGNEKDHSSLRGRDEDNQHPISAITNLQETIEDINSNITTLEDSTREKIQQLTNKLNEDIANVQSEIDNIDLTNFYTKDEIDQKAEDVMRYRGQVTTKEDLPLVNEKGDVYNVVKTGSNYVWTGKGWDNLSPALCLKKYATKDYVDGTLDASVNLLQEHLKTHYYDKDEIDEKIKDLDPSSLDKVFVYRGIVANYSKLPTDVSVGDVYKTLDNENKYFWNGFDWEILQLGEVYTEDEIDELIEEQRQELMNQIQEKEQEIVQVSNEVERIKQQLEDDKPSKIWLSLDEI